MFSNQYNEIDAATDTYDETHACSIGVCKLYEQDCHTLMTDPVWIEGDTIKAKTNVDYATNPLPLCVKCWAGDIASDDCADSAKYDDF